MKTYENAQVLILESFTTTTFLDFAQDDTEQCYYKVRRFVTLFLTAKTEAE